MPDSTVTELVTDQAAETGAVLVERLDHAREQAATATASLRDAATTFQEAAGPALHDASNLARERFATARDKASPAVHDAVHRARPTVEAAQTAFVESLLPRLAAVITSAAAGLSEAKEGATPYVDQAREAAHVGNERARDALKVLKGEATIAEPRRSSKLKWFIAIGVVAGVVGGLVAFRRSQRADDPWATPLTDPAPASLKDRAADKVADLTEAKDHTGELDASEPANATGSAETSEAAEAESGATSGTGTEAATADEAAAQEAPEATADEAADELDDAAEGERADVEEPGRGV